MLGAQHMLAREGRALRPLFSGTLQSWAGRTPGHLDTHSVLACLCNLVFPQKYLELSLGTAEEGLGWQPENVLGA